MVTIIVLEIALDYTKFVGAVKLNSLGYTAHTAGRSVLAAWEIVNVCNVQIFELVL